MKNEIKEKLDLLVKLEKVYTESSWDYDRLVEYRHLDDAKKVAKEQNCIEKKENELWEDICKKYDVKHQCHLPKEIKEYYYENVNKNHYDRFNNWKKDAIRLGVAF